MSLISTACTILNCQACMSANDCYQCKQGFFLVNTTPPTCQGEFSRSLILNVPLEYNQYINKLVAVVVVIIIIISIIIIIIIISIIIIIIITIITNIIIVIYGRISLPECRQPFSFEFFSSWRMNLSAPKFVTNVCYHKYHVIVNIMSSQIPCYHKYHVIIYVYIMLLCYIEVVEAKANVYNLLFCCTINLIKANTFLQLVPLPTVPCVRLPASARNAWTVTTWTPVPLPPYAVVSRAWRWTNKFAQLTSSRVNANFRFRCLDVNWIQNNLRAFALSFVSPTIRHPIGHR